MKSWLTVAMFALLIVAASSEHAFSFGLDVVGTGAACNVPAMSITAKFSSTGAIYSAGGGCVARGSLGSSISFQWSGTGSYSNGAASEKIIVPEAPISQPYHPYGKWETIYKCPSDPWLTGASCNIVSQSDNSSKDAKVMEGQFAPLRSQRPLTASLTQAQSDALVAQRASDLRAQARGNVARGATAQQTVAGLVTFPSVLSPSAGQAFYMGMPVAIRLGPPNGWNVADYLVNLQLRDPDPRKNSWTSIWTISVPAAQAQSAAGFTGFGPASGQSVGTFASRPGRWHINAQVSSPRQSALSDWVEFTVISPPPLNVRGPAGLIKK